MQDIHSSSQTRTIPRGAATAVLLLLLLGGCAEGAHTYPYGRSGAGVTPAAPPAVIRQPVVPEMLVPCRGHVLVPALGMVFVGRGAPVPAAGQYLREESLTPPYRVLPPGAFVSQELSPGRLNVELDGVKRIIGLYCG